MKFLILLCLLPLSSFAQEFKVLTWNTFLIPPPWNISKQKERARVMAEKLPSMGHDIMFFQETFYNKKRKLIIKALSKTHPYVAVPKPGHRITQIQDSGLFIASKFPMKVLGQVIFEDCAKSDCMAAKSAILVEITLPNGKKIQMVNTHLQAWNEPKTIATRKKQLKQIKALMSAHLKPEIPQVLVGDLNVDGKVEPEYSESLALMEMTSSPLVGALQATNGFSTEGCFKNPGGSKEGEWLDHLWVNANGTAIEIKEKTVIPMIGQLKSGECPLSDHYAVEATVKL
jgi:endonuclease/exonuclease/phosphatase family metal-dependent hydrolase